ncbi:MAG: hypothetical protein V2I97_20505 [Desulfococcaceae bacterium]|jgi:hypothetical protein|nr:hypothetical protein [Desulfococcaceae bacterium]
MKKYLLKRFFQTGFVRSAVADQADLSAFRERPAPRIILGFSLMAFSYIIGWPAVSVLGVLAVYAKEPLILAVGGPVTYGLSHLVFIAGMYFAGVKYTKIFLRWAARVSAEKLGYRLPET